MCACVDVCMCAVCVSVRSLHMRSGLDDLASLPGPWQEFVETIDRMSVDHAREHVAEIGVRFDAVQLAGCDQRADHGPALAAAVATCEEMVFAPERDGTDRALDQVRVELDAAGA